MVAHSEIETSHIHRHFSVWCSRITNTQPCYILFADVDMFKNRETFTDAQWTEMEADLDRITDSFGRVATFGDGEICRCNALDYVHSHFFMKPHLTEGCNTLLP